MELHINIHNIESYEMELMELSKAIAFSLKTNNQEINFFFDGMKDFIKFKHLINNLDLK